MNKYTFNKTHRTVRKNTELLCHPFWERVICAKSGGCWTWIGKKDGRGYGMFRGKKTHRLMYSAYFGEIKDGLLVCHKCDNPICCNPNHLFPGTNRDNSMDRVMKGRSRGGSMPGSTNKNSKLNEDLVREIRVIRSEDRKTLIEIATRFGVSVSLICQITRNQIWKHIL